VGVVAATGAASSGVSVGSAVAVGSGVSVGSAVAVGSGVSVGSAVSVGSGVAVGVGAAVATARAALSSRIRRLGADADEATVGGPDSEPKTMPATIATAAAAHGPRALRRREPGPRAAGTGGSWMPISRR
jgi:hypothetical protein